VAPRSRASAGCEERSKATQAAKPFCVLDCFVGHERVAQSRFPPPRNDGKCAAIGDAAASSGDLAPMAARPGMTAFVWGIILAGCREAARSVGGSRVGIAAEREPIWAAMTGEERRFRVVAGPVPAIPAR
jgi:hypothetical protein